MEWHCWGQSRASGVLRARGDNISSRRQQLARKDEHRKRKLAALSDRFGEAQPKAVDGRKTPN
eukprot:108314-Pyramimonas_sp.AAC.1